MQEMGDLDDLLSAKRDPESLKVAELKYWLSSWGKPVKEKKADLVARSVFTVSHYMRCSCERNTF